MDGGSGLLLLFYFIGVYGVYGGERVMSVGVGGGWLLIGCGG